MRKLLFLSPILLLAGCGSLTRAEYERANPLPFQSEYVVTDKDDTSKSGLQAGDVIVTMGPDHDPRINPVTGEYSCKRGDRVAVYRDGILIRRWFQEFSVMKGEK